MLNPAMFWWSCEWNECVDHWFLESSKCPQVNNYMGFPWKNCAGFGLVSYNDPWSMVHLLLKKWSRIFFRVKISVILTSISHRRAPWHTDFVTCFGQVTNSCLLKKMKCQVTFEGMDLDGNFWVVCQSITLIDFGSERKDCLPGVLLYIFFGWRRLDCLLFKEICW